MNRETLTSPNQANPGALSLKDQKIKDILLRGNYVTAGDIQKAEEFAKVRRTSIVNYLLEKGLITRGVLGQSLAQAFGVTFSDLSLNQPAREQVLKIPAALAEKYRAVVFREDGKSVVVATDNPAAPGLRDEIKSIRSVDR